MSIRPLSGYRLEVEFQDGRCSVLNLKARLFGTVFEVLRDLKLIPMNDVYGLEFVQSSDAPQ